jgi:ubiquitin C-terminal hydrolase
MYRFVNTIQYTNTPLCSRSVLALFPLFPLFSLCSRSVPSVPSVRSAYSPGPFVGLEPTTKQIEIIAPPQILVVHFKRLKMTYDGRGWRKIKRYVHFPLVNLNLTPYMVSRKDHADHHDHHDDGGREEHERPTHWYHLSSVVVHHGNGNNGHYTCCVKNKTTNTWTHRNDTRVTSK